jgi:hypothetical protein
MYSNPFTPIFGGKPDFFFGREAIRKRFQRALIDRGSEERALFVTGTRGSGKTALVEQLSQMASARNWQAIDLGAENLIQTLLRSLVSYSMQTKTLNPQASVSVLGTGGSLSAVSVSKTTSYEPEDLQLVFLQACEAHPKGIFISIDEVQKAPLDEIAAVCEAFQMASRKGHNAILVLAGLPYVYDSIIHHEGCTFMRRGVHERIGLFTYDDTVDAFNNAFDRIDGLEVPKEEIAQLCTLSVGHPYLIQLHGHYLLSLINDRNTQKSYRVTRHDIEEIAPIARDAFERRALRPMVDELSSLERDYLRGMALSIGPDRTARTADVARSIGKQPRQLSRARAALIGAGIILAPTRGEVMFNVPHLADYILKPRTTDAEVVLAREWRL